MAADRQPLPIEPFLGEIRYTLDSKRKLVLQASPGAGKSTLVPQALSGRVLVLQPRRIAARNVAKRIADLINEPIGRTVGYHIRNERRLSRQTRIKILTEGMLTRYLVSDPFLEQADALILDEFHERSIHADLAIAFAKTILEIREDFKLLVMSATLNTDAICDYLDGAACIQVPGNYFPIEYEYRPVSIREDPNSAIESIVKTIRREKRKGDILYFLPGARKIHQAIDTLKRIAPDWEALPFYSSLPTTAQDTIFEPRNGDDGNLKKRIICTTNIAETSLTVPNVSTVIDSGWVKGESFEPSSGTSILKETRISQASARQRAGRAGRLGPGLVFRLWSQEDHASRSPFDTPEIMRTDLTASVLSVLHHHGPDLATFLFFELPLESRLKHALETLETLEAIDSDHNLTKTGRMLLDLPLHPRTGMMLVKSSQNRKAAAVLCALMEEGRTVADPPSSLSLLDQLHLVNGEDLTPSHLISFKINHSSLKAVRRNLENLNRQIRSIWNDTDWNQPLSNKDQDLIPMLMAGYPDRLCTLKDDGKSGIMVSGAHVQFNPPITQFEYALVTHLKSEKKGRGNNLGVLSAIGLNWGMLQKYAVNLIRKKTQSWFDEAKGEVVSREQWIMGQRLVVRLGSYLADTNEHKANILSNYILENFDREFKLDAETEKWLWRLRFAQVHLPDVSWPDVSEEGLKDSIPDVCRKIAVNEPLKLTHFHGFNWIDYWRSFLDWQAFQTFEKEVPAHMVTPSGKKAFFDYKPAFGPEGRPVFSGVLQHLFGLNEAPILAFGTVKPLIHILGPNRRPVQVTSDLAGFWTGSYQQVRKELKGRYPKHDWPENP